MPAIATSGSFKPGQSGNPSGRPAGSSRLQIAMLRLLDEAVEVHTAILRGKFSDYRKATLQFAAAREVFDRGFGRAAQTVALDLGVQSLVGERKLSELSDDELVELRRRIALAAVATPTVIEVTAEPSREAQFTQGDLLENGAEIEGA